jgi:RNA recognition motif-containing protein
MCLGMSPTGESKGFAHVDLGDVASAEGIMKANLESQFFLEGRGLNLDFAGPPSSKPSFPPSNTLHFSNYSGDEDTLQSALQEFAPVIKSIRISEPFFLLDILPVRLSYVPQVRNQHTGESSRFGFIECNELDGATALIEKFNGKEIAYGETLALSYARGRKTESAPSRYGQGGDSYGFGARGRPGGFNNRSQEGFGGRGGSGSAAGEDPF